ncbi:MAG: glycosyltransferase family 9 protein, partial [Verrucomicrobiales bacterium]
YEMCLSVESSIPHIAASYGVRCAVLYGPGDPTLTRPLGKQHLAVRRKVECSPCHMNRCTLDLRCQHDLTPNLVVETLSRPNGS